MLAKLAAMHILQIVKFDPKTTTLCPNLDTKPQNQPAAGVLLVCRSPEEAEVRAVSRP